MSFWNPYQQISSFASQTICSLGDDRADQQYVAVISLITWMDSDGEQSTICLCDLLLYDSYSMHTVWTTGRWAVLATTSCSLILLWFKYRRSDKGFMLNQTIIIWNHLNMFTINSSLRKDTFLLKLFWLGLKRKYSYILKCVHTWLKIEALPTTVSYCKCPEDTCCFVCRMALWLFIEP